MYNNPEYYNYINNNYNQPLYNNTNKVYDAYQGLIRGNLFPELYNGYKVNPIELKPLNEQAKMLTNLDSLCFALTDLNLYLDLYPDDKNMIGLYNQYRIQEKNLLNEYESKFGPITLKSESIDSYPFSWINNPWPWMGGK